MTPAQFARAAEHLLAAHERRERFAPLPAELAPRTSEEGYAIQDAFVALRAQQRGAIVGYKIALASPQMRRFAGVEQPQAGAILESTVRRSPARLRLADYVRLIVEFEIAVEMAADLPVADAPFTRERVAQAVASVAAALEIADDRGADYATLPQHPFELIADNTWNEGVVLGEAVKDWAGIDLAAVRGVARVNGRPIGEGRGADAMGHPLASVAWVADHLAAHGRGLLRGDFVITGSLVTSFAPQRGDRIRFSAQRLGEVELEIE